ncbi:hypothetical protein ACE6H2_016327 [Prunus campanulata]
MTKTLLLLLLILYRVPKRLGMLLAVWKLCLRCLLLPAHLTRWLKQPLPSLLRPLYLQTLLTQYPCPRPRVHCRPSFSTSFEGT